MKLCWYNNNGMLLFSERGQINCNDKQLYYAIYYEFKFTLYIYICGKDVYNAHISLKRAWHAVICGQYVVLKKFTCSIIHITRIKTTHGHRQNVMEDVLPTELVMRSLTGQVHNIMYGATSGHRQTQSVKHRI